MRGTRIGLIGALVGLTATVGLGGVPANASDGHGRHGHGHDHEVINVRILDKCDPVSFNAGGVDCHPVMQQRVVVTLNELIASFDPVNHTASPAWRFSPSRIEAEVGDTLHLTNRGGEGHSFTEVPSFGGGCVDFLNAAVGLTEVTANCPADFGTVQPPNGTRDITLTSAGEHKFICVIHPWMRATVDVEGDGADD